MDITDIVNELNKKASGYRFGSLQKMRQERLGLSRLPSRFPFNRSTVFDHYAFHVGGRAELQFNVGFDRGGDVRWGVALSLQKNRTVPHLDDQFARLNRLNEFIRLHRDDYLNGFWMWHYSPQGRSEDRLPDVVPENLYREKVFIFLGNHAPKQEYRADLVLGDLDCLMPIYCYVEDDRRSFPSVAEEAGFKFQPNVPNEKPTQTVAKTNAFEKSVSLRHNVLQECLEHELRSEEDAEVASEHPDGIGGKIDVVVRRRGSLEFFEIKVGQSARSCIRQAIGQLLEYGFWPGAGRPNRLVVAGEPALDSAASQFLKDLRETFRIPIYYRQIIVP